MGKKCAKGIVVLLACMCALTEFSFAGTQALAPQFELQDIHKGKVSLSSFKDTQPVLLFFWTTWCPFCRKELNIVNEKYQELVADGVEVLAIDVGEPGYKVENYLKKSPVNFKVLLDADTTVSNSYDVLGVPTFVLVDKKGYILFQGNNFPESYKRLIEK